MQTVAQTFIRKTDRVYTLVYDTGTKLQTTATHPFYIEGKGWVKAADLHLGDDSLLSREVSQLDVYGGARLQNVSYRQSKQGVIAGITVEDRAETVYNFEVNETHTYLVGESDVVVHNAEYSVVSGDNLEKIAKKLNIPLDALYEANPGLKERANKLKIGEKLEYSELSDVEKRLRAAKTPEERRAIFKSLKAPELSVEQTQTIIEVLTRGKPKDFQELVQAAASQESGWKHTGADGKVQANHPSVDVGVMQINSEQHAVRFYLEQLATNPAYNIQSGIRLLEERYNQAKAKGYKGDDLLKATYSLYQHGSKIDLERRQVKSFYEKLKVYRASKQ